jgi:bacteriorhodopsin
MFWPSIFLIVALLLVVVASIVGITRAGDLEHTYYSVGCSVAITMDDILNGNRASTG